MAKGSVRKKGKKWYYRFYVEDASGNRVQKEFPGTESKSETESLLRKAMEDYETKMFLAQAKNITLGDMLDMWVEEELKPGSLSDGTVTAYINTVSRIKKHPIGKRKLKTVTSDHLQSYMDLLSFGGTSPDGKTVEALSKGSLGQYSAVLQNSFRFAVFPKRLITFNPMQYVVKRVKDDEYELFTEDGTELGHERGEGGWWTDGAWTADPADFDHPEQCTKASYDYFAAVPENCHSLTVKVYDFDTDAELTTFTVELP